MTPFDICCKNTGISAIYDRRYIDLVDITDGTGRFAQLVYTPRRADITKENKPEFVPYVEHFAEYDTCRGDENRLLMESKEFQTTLTVTQQQHLVFNIQCLSDAVSCCGIFLPLNFMSCKNGKREQQFLPSSPYHTADKKHWMHFFTRPDGKHLVLIVEGALEGYKINYSPYLSGHFICGFSFLWRLDRAYHTATENECKMRVHVIPVSSYEEALQWAVRIWEIPAIYYRAASVRVGEEFAFQAIGNVDKICICGPSGKTKEITGTAFTAEEYGIHQITPYNKGTAGMDAAVFAWDDKDNMYRKSMDCLLCDHKNIIGYTASGTGIWRPPYLFYRGFYDHNLCEHGMWCWAMLRYMRLHGIVKEYAEEVKNFLGMVMVEDGGYTNAACSILKEQGYRTKDSTRIQEAYNGVNILLDAWRVFGERKYLTFAMETLTARLEYDVSEDGAILRRGSDGTTAEIADYTTVTCMVFPVVDMAMALKETGDSRYHYFEAAAIKIADYVVKRGLCFPTEGGEHPEVNEELEDGSVSCSALTVCYVAAHLCLKPEYLAFAREVLRLHDAFSVYTPHPVLFRSSLRWWETIWEGDSDGPAVCFGHAWSLWRAEAQFWYGLLCADKTRLFDSYQGFMGNYAKENQNGDLYTIYQYEPISGGAVATSGNEMTYCTHDGFPIRADITLSRYLFARDFACWLSTAAVIELDGKVYYLGCHLDAGEIISDGAALKRIYIDVPCGEYVFLSGEGVEVICPQEHRMSRRNGRLVVSVSEGKTVQ